MRLRLILFGVLAVLCGGAWSAWAAPEPVAASRELKPDQAARLERGQVLVETTPDQDRVERVWAAEDIDAPPDVVWRVMTDCAEALHYVPRLKACEVVDSDPDGRWDVRRHRLATLPLFPDLKATFRLDYDRPREMHFRQIDGDMSGSSGEWRLTPLDGGRRTRVSYAARLKLPSGVPGPIARAVLKGDAPSALEGLRQRSLEAARRTAQ